MRIKNESIKFIISNELYKELNVSIRNEHSDHSVFIRTDLFNLLGKGHCRTVKYVITPAAVHILYEKILADYVKNVIEVR